MVYINNDDISLLDLETVSLKIIMNLTQRASDQTKASEALT